MQDYFLIKKTKIVPFQAQAKDNSLCAYNVTPETFEQGDLIISKTSLTPPTVSIDSVVDSFTNDKDVTTTILVEPVSPQNIHVDDIRTKLKALSKDIHAGDISSEEKKSLISKADELEKAIGTSKFDDIFQEYMGMLMEYEQYFPAVMELFKL